MPQTQSRTNIPFLQIDSRFGSDNVIYSNDNIAIGSNNNISFSGNAVVGNFNSVAGESLVIGNYNIIPNTSKAIVSGSYNTFSSISGILIGNYNNISAPVSNFNLFGVNNLTMTQSVNDVWIFGNSATFSTIVPTQSGVYINQPVYLGPGVNILNFNGLPFVGNQNLNGVLTVGNTTGGQDIEMSIGDVIFSSALGNVDINTHKISNTTAQTINFVLFGFGFANTSPLSNTIDLNKVNSFTFYVNGINATQTLGYYGELRVALRCDGAGNITQIGVDDLYEVSDFTTVTINSNFVSANQMNIEITGEAGETIDYDISWRRI